MSFPLRIPCPEGPPRCNRSAALLRRRAGVAYGSLCHSGCRHAAYGAPILLLELSSLDVDRIGAVVGRIPAEMPCVLPVVREHVRSREAQSDFDSTLLVLSFTVLGFFRLLIFPFFPALGVQCQFTCGIDFVLLEFCEQAFVREIQRM